MRQIYAALAAVSLMVAGAAFGDVPTAPSASARPTAASHPRASFPAQADVASKTAQFGAAEGAPKNAVDVHNLTTAKTLIGKSATFQGTVSSVYIPHGNSIVILDFDPDYRSAIVAVVKPDAYSKFPALTALTGKHVVVRGPVVAYEGRPQIALTKPSQIDILP